MQEKTRTQVREMTTSITNYVCQMSPGPRRTKGASHLTSTAVIQMPPCEFSFLLVVVEQAFPSSKSYGMFQFLLSGKQKLHQLYQSDKRPGCGTFSVSHMVCIHCQNLFWSLKQFNNTSKIKSFFSGLSSLAIGVACTSGYKREEVFCVSKVYILFQKWLELKVELPYSFMPNVCFPIP